MSDTTPPTEPSPEPQTEPPAREELLELALLDLRERRATLLGEIKVLEQRRQQLDADLNGSPSGRADGIARRLKGFQDYLVVALQDLASQAELMDLVVQPLQLQPSPLDTAPAVSAAAAAAGAGVQQIPPAGVQQIPPAAAGQFSQDAELIRDRLSSFQGQPDFYADPWKLRRSLEPTAAALLDDWFLSQGGRGAQASSGSRNRNALITAGAVAILGDLYGERFQTLVLAGEPERLGEWRRGLQDCLGLAREDFGPNSGIVLFERPDALIERADRLEERGELPFIVVDAAEQVVDIPVLQFPLWLAFAATANELALEQDLS
ncbi:DUF3086 domain-containing protein [Synechococcus sp. CS-1329]|uniref:DUF3086 domain-containing protein n=1 Tax=Synechococcus sp. CS-1329 TaxID=2847975 RepID=UPI00223B14E6|nr:DUF3086 domain-containing protein [Synechococcus sp. CS-1329]MCT0218673.1 DUF3086 domain-containing protein [Synechococcus sp. CS-1329]